MERVLPTDCDIAATIEPFDAVVDFEKCLADPSDPRKMLPMYDSGDHLHPSDLGYVHMGECIDLSLFK